MKLLLIALFLLSNPIWSKQVSPYESFNQLAMGTNHTCLIDDKGLKCWGNNTIDDSWSSRHIKLGKLFLPENSSKPIMVSAESRYTCGLYKNAIKCWGAPTYNDSYSSGRNYYEINGERKTHRTPIHTKKFEKESPHFLATADDQYCYILGNKVECSRPLRQAYDDDSQEKKNNNIKFTPLKNLIKPLMLALGKDHSCVLDQEKNGSKIKCWGLNNSGELDVPKSIKNPVYISAGNHHTCALDDNGVICWGSNKDGVLRSHREKLRNPKFISAGANHTCAIDQGKVKCWGNNKHGQTDVPDHLINPILVKARHDRTCAIDDNGVQCWGFDDGNHNIIPKDSFDYSKAKIAVGTLAFCSYTKTEIDCTNYDKYIRRKNFKQKVIGKDISQVIIAKEKICYVDDSGLNCWNPYREKSQTTHLKGQSKDIKSIFARTLFHCAIVKNEVKCFGSNQDIINNIPKNLKFPSHLVASANHACVIDQKKVKCWGDKSGYRAGIITNIPKDLINPTQLSAGLNYVCALDQKKLRCWDNEVDRLGEKKYFSTKRFNEFFSSLKNPKLVSHDNSICVLDKSLIKCFGPRSTSNEYVPRPKTFISGGQSFCMIDSGGLDCTSYIEKMLENFLQKREINYCRKYYNRTKCSNHLNPSWALDLPAPKISKLKKKINKSLRITLKSESHRKGLKIISKINGSSMKSDEVIKLINFKKDIMKQVAVGAKSICINTGRGIQCWGEGLNVPTQLRDVKAIAAGHSYICAHNNQEVYCWRGKDLYNKPTLEVKTFDNITDLDVGTDHFCVIANQKVNCWGSNKYGQSKYKKGLIKNPLSLALGEKHSCVLTTTGVKCWGDNKHGQLDIPKLNKPFQISSQRNHTCVIDTEGVKCWGANHYGQASIPEVRNPISVTVGDRHTCVLNDQKTECWGYNKYGQTNVPKKLKKTAAIFAGLKRTCALDKNGFHCWGDSSKKTAPINLNILPGSKNSKKFDAVSIQDDGKYCSLRNKKFNCESRDIKNYSNVKELITGDAGSFCLKRESGVLCYGRNMRYEFKGTKISDLAVSYKRFCAIVNGKIECINGFYRSRKKVYVEDSKKYPKKITNPYKIATTKEVTCALGDEGVRCWAKMNISRNRRNIVFSSPEKLNIKNPTDIAIDSKQACVIEDGQVKCWSWKFIHDYNGRFNRVKYDVNKTPSQITDVKEILLPNNDGTACVLHSSKVTCWNSEKESTRDDLENPRNLTVNGKNICVVDTDGTKCWSNEKEEEENEESSFDYAESHHQGFQSCLANKETEVLDCFKFFDQRAKLKISELYQSSRLSSASLSAFLEKVIDSSNRVKGMFAKSLLKYANSMSHISLESKYANEYHLFRTIGFVIKSNDSRLYRNELGPLYETTMANLKDFKDHRDKNILRTHLKATQSALNIATHFSSTKEKRKIATLKKLLGRSYSKPADQQRLNKFTKSLRKNLGIFRPLRKSSKTQFIVEIIKNSLQYLEK